MSYCSAVGEKMARLRCRTWRRPSAASTPPPPRQRCGNRHAETDRVVLGGCRQRPTTCRWWAAAVGHRAGAGLLRTVPRAGAGVLGVPPPQCRAVRRRGLVMEAAAGAASRGNSTRSRRRRSTTHDDASPQSQSQQLTTPITLPVYTSRYTVAHRQQPGPIQDSRL